MEEFIRTNWITIALSVYACASEIIGINPAWKSNSVVQVIMNVIGRILGKKETV